MQGRMTCEGVSSLSLEVFEQKWIITHERGCKGYLCIQ